jgi:hypothetical protein
MNKFFVFRYPLVLLVLIGGSTIYLLGVGGGFVFDDATSLEPLRNLQTNPDYFWPLVFSNMSGPLGRPISVLTFALEQRFLSGSVELTQAISICIHAINAVLVFCLLKLIFRLHNLRNAWVLAVFGAVLWAYAPQKVSTVLYMVQRMTLLAAFFILLACCSYLYARRFSTGKRQIAAFLICIACVFLAPFAKENGVLALPLLVCIELFVIPSRRSNGADVALRRAALLMVLMGGGLYLYLGVSEYLRSDASFALRSFTYLDRLFSIPLMLIDYATQFFLPRTEQMGVFHDDFVIAKDRPLTAFFCGGLLLAGFMYLGQQIWKNERSVPGFGIAFFLAGHSIESSFLPLELYFEHRNYLPSVGLVVCLCYSLSSIAQQLNAKGRYFLTSAGGAYLAAVVFATATLAPWWSSTYLLVRHHLIGHPDSARAHAESALYEAAAGRFETSLASIERGFELSRSQPAARSMGAVDKALMASAAACLSGNKKLIPPFQFDELLEAWPVRMVSVQLLWQLYEGQKCVDADWGELSDWILSLTLYFNENGESLGRSALVDLAQMETVRGNPTGAYIYGAMAIEQSLGNGTALLIMAKASMAAGDRQALRDIQEKLGGLEGAGKLSPVNLQVFRSFVANREIQLSAHEDDDK